MNSIENSTQSAVRMEVVNEQPKPVYRNIQTPIQQRYEVEENYVERVETSEQQREVRNAVAVEESTETKIRRSFFDRYVDKIKDFLDNAE
jgi:cell division protein FtsA